MGYLQGILFFSMIVTIVGVLGYGFEVSQDRIGRAVRWDELNTWQFACAVASIGGTFLFVTTLIIGVITK
jgi:hypothetical protein